MVVFSSKQAFGFDFSSRADTPYYYNFFLKKERPEFAPRCAPISRDGFTAEENAAADLLEGKPGIPHLDQKIKRAIIWANIFKILGYIPIIGTGVGIGRFFYVITRSSAEKPNKSAHILRAILEITSCGPLLIIVDIVLTIERRSSHSQAALA